MSYVIYKSIATLCHYHNNSMKSVPFTYEEAW